jgi:hypothetical protein
MRRRVAILTLFGTWLLCGRAFAHDAGTSYLHIAAPSPEADVALRWELAQHDILSSIFIDGDFDGAISGPELEAAREQIAAAVRSQISLERGDAVCEVRVGAPTLTRRDALDFLTVPLTALCPQPGLLKVGGFMFMPGGTGQRVLLSLQRGGDVLTGVISAAEPVWSEPERPSAWRDFARFVGEGMWHVFIGYDHVAFVLLLLLPSVLRPVNGQWQGALGFGEVLRDIVTIVTAFTISHSITLGLAVTGVVQLPGKPIEIAIAASIAVAGLVNVVPKLAPLRLPLALGFGLVHGFGFANALDEIDASGTALLPLLAGFNLGVEFAQLAIVAVVLPLIYAARTRRWYAGGVMPLGSCVLGAAGLVWLLQRI